MASQEDITSQQELLAAYRRTLAQLLKQQALVSELYAPPALTHGIDEARENIQHLKAILRSWDVLVEDHPGDEAPVARRPIAATSPTALGRPESAAAGRGAGAACIGQRARVRSAVQKTRAGGDPVGRGAGWTQCGSLPTVVLPSEIAPAQDPARAAAQLAQAIASKQINSWKAAGPDVEALYASEPGYPRPFFATIHGTGEGRVNLQLMSKAQLAIAAQDDARSMSKSRLYAHSISSLRVDVVDIAIFQPSICSAMPRNMLLIEPTTSTTKSPFLH